MDEFTQVLSTHETALQLLAALLLGMLVGIERGWEARDKEAGQRIAGIRTHALVGLLGGLGVLLGNHLGQWIFPTLLLAVTAVGLSGYFARARQVEDVSVTNIISLILTFCFGAMAVAGEVVLAAAAAVVTVILLDNKREIHGLLRKLQAHELDAAFKLLLISVVVLPLLPNEAMGPFDALNPFELWWMVVLIAGISFVGYFSVRVWGARRGVLFTSLFAGLSSSTALTLAFSRYSRSAPAASPLLASGILIACGTMFPRILVYAVLLAPGLLPMLLLPVMVMTLTLYVPAIYIWRRHRGEKVDQPLHEQNPLDMKSALVFGLLLAAIMLLASWLREIAGDQGLYLLAAASGVADVDAITLSLTRMSKNNLNADTAVMAIIIAASVNSLVKAGMTLVVGTRRLGLPVIAIMLVSVASGLSALFLMRM